MMINFRTPLDNQFMDFSRQGFGDLSEDLDEH